MLLSLSWKNIWRNKTRSLIIIFAIVFGVIGGVGIIAFMNGLFSQRLEMAIGNEVSNIQIHNSHFQINKELNDTIFDISKLTSVLGTSKKIKAYSFRLKSVAMINSANSGEGVMLNGIDPEKEKAVTAIYKYIQNGSYFADNKKNGILIGEKLARKLKIKMRSKVVLTMQSISGNITSAAFKVIGIYKTSNSTFDGHNGYVRKSDLAAIIGVGMQTSHEIAIAVYNDKESEGLVASLKHKCNDDKLSIERWDELMPELGLMTNTMGYLVYIFMSIIFLALSFGIINTMLMAVMERMREIGMLMAIGMNKTKIFLMIMLETILLMLTGSFVGLVLSYAIVNFFGKYGIDLSKFASGFSGLGFSSMVHPFLETVVYFNIVIMVVIAGIISSIIPARRALKLNPSEAIRKL
jgi:ABC-type lipoprotein release transport system permease subunit